MCFAVAYTLIAWAGAALVITIRQRHTARSRGRWRLLAPQMAVCAFVVASFCYPSFTNAAMSLFSCRTLDVSAETELGEVVDASGPRWTLVRLCMGMGLRAGAHVTACNASTVAGGCPARKFRPVSLGWRVSCFTC
jgi:hypothetical protein